MFGTSSSTSQTNNSTGATGSLFGNTSFNTFGRNQSMSSASSLFGSATTSSGNVNNNSGAGAGSFASGFGTGSNGLLQKSNSSAGFTSVGTTGSAFGSLGQNSLKGNGLLGNNNTGSIGGFGTVATSSTTAPGSSSGGGLGLNLFSTGQTQGQNNSTLNTSGTFGLATGTAGISANNNAKGNSIPGFGQQATANSLFGGAGGLNNTSGSFSTSNKNGTTNQGSLFSNSLLNQNANGSSNFGSTVNSTSLISNNAATTSNNSVPGVRIDLSNLRATTRYSDLHPELQQIILNVHNYINEQISMASSCAAVMSTAGRPTEASLSYGLECIPNDVDLVTAKLEATEAALDNDASMVSSLQVSLRNAESDAQNIGRVIESVKLPFGPKISGLWHQYVSTSVHGASRNSNKLNLSIDRINDLTGVGSSSLSNVNSEGLVQFFNRRTRNLEQEFSKARNMIQEIEAHLKLVEMRAASDMEKLARRSAMGTVTCIAKDDGSDESRVAIFDSEAADNAQFTEVVETMKAFEGGIIRAASRVGELREKVVDCYARMGLT